MKNASNEFKEWLAYGGIELLTFPQGNRKIAKQLGCTTKDLQALVKGQAEPDSQFEDKAGELLGLVLEKNNFNTLYKDNEKVSFHFCSKLSKSDFVNLYDYKSHGGDLEFANEIVCENSEHYDYRVIVLSCCFENISVLVIEKDSTLSKMIDKANASVLHNDSDLCNYYGKFKVSNKLFCELDSFIKVTEKVEPDDITMLNSVLVRWSEVAELTEQGCFSDFQRNLYNESR